MTHQHSEQASKHDTKPQVDTELSTEQDAPIFQPKDILYMQRTVGNAAVQRLLKNGQMPSVGKSPRLIQRNPAGGGYPFPAPDPVLDPFIQKTYYHEDGKFFLRYYPTGGAPSFMRPIVGLATATLRLHVEFQNFDVVKDKEPYKDMQWTPQQQAEFNWQDAEKATFQSDLQKSIQDGWSDKHILQANNPGFEQVSTRLFVKVRLVTTPDTAHVKIKSIKTPTGAPRLRSEAGMDEATMDWRDPTVADKTTQTLKYFNISPFADDSDDPSTLAPQMDEVVKYLVQEGAGGKRIKMKITGRSTTPGSEAYNKDLSRRRGANVQEYIHNNTPDNIMIGSQVEALGETGTTDDPSFRRVDVEIVQDGTQNTAAHEAGHMFGLDDEYEDEKWDTGGGKGRFNGDKPDHFEDVKNELGEKAADEMITDSSDSIMAGGDVVEAGHYVPFIQAMEAATGIQWTIQ